VVWKRPSTKSQVLARLKALRLEELAGVEIGSGYIPVAAHSVTFCSQQMHAETSDQGLTPIPGDIETKLKLGEREFAGICFSVQMRNDLSFPWPLHMNFDLGELDDGLHIVECSIEFQLAGSAYTEDVGDRKRYPGDLEVAPQKEIRRSKVKLTPKGSSPKNPGWGIELVKGPIGSFTAKNLLKVCFAEEGDVVRAILIVPLKGLHDGSDDD